MRSVISFVTILISFACYSQNQLGFVASLDKDSIVHASGFTLIGTTVQSVISPSIPDSVFAKTAERVSRLKTKLYMCNVLFPGALKIAGPDVDEQKVLTYLEQVLTRAKQLGIKNLILGSGGARRLPDQYDVKTATNDFISLCRKMASLAARYDVTIILENLNASETNFLTTVQSAANVVRKVDHPNFRLNVDLYHMMKENESPQEIVKAGKLIVYCEIAEKEKRTLPGVTGENFIPYLKALIKIGYTGPIVVEGNSSDLKKDLPLAHAYIRSQFSEARKN